MKPEILVTGANGFTGNWLCQFLTKKGIPVRGLVHQSSQSNTNPLIEYVSGDLRDRASLDKAMVGIKTVMHLAALFRPSNVGKKEFWDVNVEGTKNVIESAVKAHVEKFVHCSTVGVHGTTGNKAVNEEGAIAPDDPYQESKWEGEKLAIALAKEKKLDLTVIRPAGIYGPGERRFLKLTQLIKKGRFIMFGDGRVSYHFVHVNDLSEAFWLAANSKKSNGRVYLIADNSPIDIRDVVDLIAKTLGVPSPKLRLPFSLLWGAAIVTELLWKPFGINPPLHRRRAAWFSSGRAYNIDRAKQELHFLPQVETGDGLKEMVESYGKAGWLK